MSTDLDNMNSFFDDFIKTMNLVCNNSGAWKHDDFVIRHKMFILDPKSRKTGCSDHTDYWICHNCTDTIRVHQTKFNSLDLYSRLTRMENALTKIEEGVSNQE